MIAGPVTRGGRRSAASASLVEPIVRLCALNQERTHGTRNVSVDELVPAAAAPDGPDPADDRRTDANSNIEVGVIACERVLGPVLDNITVPTHSRGLLPVHHKFRRHGSDDRKGRAEPSPRSPLNKPKMRR
jgi:hypothetical protein